MNIYSENELEKSIKEAYPISRTSMTTAKTIITYDDEEEEDDEDVLAVTGNDGNNNLQDNDDYDSHCCAAAAAGDIRDDSNVACRESFIKVHSDAAEDDIAATDDVIDSNDM